MGKIAILNYGCCANLSNAEIMAGLLNREGYLLVEERDADIIIINTCVVKQPTESKIIHKIKTLQKNYPEKKIVLAGCMPEAEYSLCKKIAKNSSLINTFHISEIVKVVKSVEKGKKIELLGKRKEDKNCLPVIRKNKSVANIQISEGCVNNCAFCITKIAKGKLYSFPEYKILDDVKNAVKDGCTRINITSQDNAAYGKDRGKYLFPYLLKKILEIKGNFKIRIGMMNPENVLPILNELIEIYKNDKVLKFLHIPVQSGSNRILKKMGRNYKVEDFKKIVYAFKDEVKNICISTDIIVGFPGESEEDFNKTLNLIKEIKPGVLNISKFAPRPGTMASKMKQIRPDIIKRRSKILFEEYKKLKCQSDL